MIQTRLTNLQKAFYKTCRAAQGEAFAAFQADRFLHNFLHDLRNNKDSEEFFLQRQQGKIREFDGEPLPPFTLPATPDHRHRPPQAAAAAQAIPGRGPQTVAARAAKERGVYFAARVVTPLFSTLARDSDSDVDIAEERMRKIDLDVEIIGKGKGKMKEKENKVLVKNQKLKVPQVELPKPPVEEQSEDEEMEDIAQLQPIINKPPKKLAAKPGKVVTEDED